MSRRDQIAEALRGHCDADRGYLDPEEIADALLPLVDRLCADAAAEALTAARNDWQWGQWDNAPGKADRVVERIANAQYVTDWLTTRAAAVNPSKEQQP